MFKNDFFVKECRKCGYLVNEDFIICPECQFDNSWPIPKEFKGLTFIEMRRQLDDAFFRLDWFSKGRTKSYNPFDFNGAFSKLFLEAAKPENFNLDNCNLIEMYWQLIVQLDHDFDKGEFESECCYEDDNFLAEQGKFSDLIWHRAYEFAAFSTPDQIKAQEHRASISDILTAYPLRGKTPPPAAPKPALDPDYVDDVYKLLRVNFREEQRGELYTVLKTGTDATAPLLFLGNGNRLTDAFGQLKKFDILAGCKKKDLIEWIIRNFSFLKGEDSTPYKYKSIEAVISTNTPDVCKNPLFVVRKDSSGKKSISAY